VIIHLGRRPI